MTDRWFLGVPVLVDYLIITLHSIPFSHATTSGALYLLIASPWAARESDSLYLNLIPSFARPRIDGRFASSLSTLLATIKHHHRIIR